MAKPIPRWNRFTTKVNAGQQLFSSIFHDLTSHRPGLPDRRRNLERTARLTLSLGQGNNRVLRNERVTLKLNPLKLALLHKLAHPLLRNSKQPSREVRRDQNAIRFRKLAKLPKTIPKAFI